MLQMSKIMHSRDDWKKKAVERATEIREFRKTQKRHQEKIVELKRLNHQLKFVLEKKQLLPPTSSA